MIMTIASWRCNKCGTLVKVKAETDKKLPTISRIPASCPGCGDVQNVYAHRIVAVTGQKGDQAKL